MPMVCLVSRTMVEIRESEQRAHMQAEILKSALEEHSLELRVKAANEAENACLKRLTTAETEISDLKAKLDASERFSFLPMTASRLTFRL